MYNQQNAVQASSVTDPFSDKAKQALARTPAKSIDSSITSIQSTSTSNISVPTSPQELSHKETKSVQSISKKSIAQPVAHTHSFPPAKTPDHPNQTIQSHNINLNPPAPVSPISPSNTSQQNTNQQSSLSSITHSLIQKNHYFINPFNADDST